MIQFSIIIPTFNRARVIERAIISVLNQDYQNWELLIIDDSSTDDTKFIVEAFKSNKIRYFELKVNRGAGYCRNFGVEKSKGTVIVFLDSDDFLEKCFLSEFFLKISKSETSCGFFWSGRKYLFGSNESNQIWIPERKNNSSYLTFLHSLHIGASGLVVKKDVFLEVGKFNPLLHAAEDTEFILRISQKFDYEVVREILVNVDMNNSNRLSHDYSKIAYSYNNFIKQHVSEIFKCKTLIKKYYYKLMWLNYHAGERKSAQKSFFILLKNNVVSLKILLIFFVFEIFGKHNGIKIHLWISKRKVQ